MSNSVISDTNKFLRSISKKSDKPSDIEFTLYLLAKDFGIAELQRYPAPYLQGLIKTYSYMKDLELKASKN